MQRIESLTLSSAKAFIMTAVSSEWSRFRIRQIPLPNAARIRARFEILLLPGVAIVMGDLLGVEETTVAASQSTLRITSSLTTVAFSSQVLPIRDKRTIFLFPPEFFLSIAIISINRSTVKPEAAGSEAIRRSVSDTGKPYACRQRVNRPTAT